MSSVVMPLQSRRDHWTDGLMLTNRGVPLGNLRNLTYALRNAPEWHGVLAYDEFAARVITRKPPPWSDQTAERWTGLSRCPRLRMVPGAADCRAGRGGGSRHSDSGTRHPFHPVRDYLNALNWDGTLRLDTWLTTYLGVEDSQYSRAIGSRFLISAVARVLSPGCQVDHVLILEGPQGILKSSALQSLADPWFTDRISKLGGKDFAMEVAGVWLIEMSELDALTKATNSTIKSFVTRRHDRFRPPYGKYLVDHPRGMCLHRHHQSRRAAILRIRPVRGGFGQSLAA